MGSDASDGHALAMRLRVAYLAMHRRTNAACARLGLTADQFVVMTTLAERDATSQKDLVERTGSDPNTMSQILTRLEDRGLIERRRDLVDGRAKTVILTPAGRRVQGRLWNRSAPIRAALAGGLTPDALARLLDQLDGVTCAMQSSDDATNTRISLSEPARDRVRADGEI